METTEQKKNNAGGWWFVVLIILFVIGCAIYKANKAPSERPGIFFETDK